MDFAYTVNFYHMIRPINREEVFSRSRLADHYIRDEQRVEYNPDKKLGMDDMPLEVEGYEIERIILDDSLFDDNADEDTSEYSDEEGLLMKDVADHLEPLHGNGKLTNDFAVLGYPRKNIVEYVANRSKALIRFFEIMNIRQLYLMDVMKYDWLRFPFRSCEKLAAIKSLVNVPSYREAFEMDIGELSFILPLFDHSTRWGIPIIVFISADDHVPIAMFFCQDGNFHASFHTEDREKIFYAASAVGLVMGGSEVCNLVYNI